MSKFRDKAAEIRAAGEAQRGNFEPSGVPLRLYNFWLDNSKGSKANDIRRGRRKENFCHFWRVVAIWAPLTFLGKKGRQILGMKYTEPTLAALVLLGAISVPLYAGGWAALAILAGSLFFAAGIIGMGAWLAYLAEQYPQRVEKVLKWSSIAIASIAAVGALAMFIYWGGWSSVAILAVGAVVGLVVRLNIERISDYIHYRRDLRQKREDEQGEALRKAYDAYLMGEGPNPSVTKFRKPSAFERRLSAIFKGIGDFIIMAAQVVRVNKWKICPIVEIDSK